VEEWRSGGVEERRVINVSLETMRIVDGLPKLAI
jgi:hypothetical protein